MLNGDQKQYGKRITEDREVGVIRLMPRYGRSMSLPSFYPGRPDGATSETWNSGEAAVWRWWRVLLGTGRDSGVWQIARGPPGGPWAYRCGVQRKVLPGERFVISPQIGEDEAMSMDNIQWVRVYTMRNEKRTSDEPGNHPHLEEWHKNSQRRPMGGMRQLCWQWRRFIFSFSWWFIWEDMGCWPSSYFSLGRGWGRFGFEGKWFT